MTDDNPYQAPLVTDPPSQIGWNRWAVAGLMLNVVAVVAVLLAALPEWSWFAMRAAFICLPGIVCCSVGLFRPRRDLAFVGVLLGCYVALYLPYFAFTMQQMQLHSRP